MAWTYDAIIGFSNGMLKGNILKFFVLLRKLFNADFDCDQQEYLSVI